MALHHSTLVHRTVVIYGPSGSGKSVIVKDIMAAVKDRIEQIILVCPTEPVNNSYKGIIPATAIHTRMHLPDPTEKRDTPMKSAIRFLETLYARQDMMASIYNRANTPETLAQLYSRLSHKARKSGDEFIASLQRKRLRAIRKVQDLHSDDPGYGEQQAEAVNEKFKQVLVLVYKKFLAPNVDTLWEKKLSEDERYSLQYLHFNPNLLLIFDDCAAELKPLLNKDVFRKLFYQNRHSFITLVISCQDDTDLLTNLKKNAFISIFTTKAVAISNFSRAANNHTKTSKDLVTGAVDIVFVGHRKLLYVREDPKQQNFYTLTCARPRAFQFGSAAFWELCQMVESQGVAMDTTNDFYEKFRVAN